MEGKINPIIITTKKQENGTEIVGNIFEKGSNTTTGTDIIQYKTIILRVGFDEKRDGYINPCLDVINDNIPTFNSVDDNDTYKQLCCSQSTENYGISNSENDLYFQLLMNLYS